MCGGSARLVVASGLRMSKPTVSTAPPGLCYNTYQSRVMRGKFIISIPPIHNTLPKRQCRIGKDLSPLRGRVRLGFAPSPGLRLGLYGFRSTPHVSRDRSFKEFFEG